MNGPAAPPQTVAGTVAAGSIQTCTAGWPPGDAQPAWVHFGSLTVIGRTCSVSLTLDPLWTAGTSAVTVRMAVQLVDGTLAWGDVALTYVVMSFGAVPIAVSSSSVFGSSVLPASRTVRVSARTSTSWTVSADQPWIQLDPVSGTSTTSAPTVTISFLPGSLQPGTTQGTLTFTSGAGATSQVAVTYALGSPVLTSSPSSVALAGLGGHDLSPKRVQLSLDTGTNAWPFTVATTDGWIDLVQVATTISSTPKAAFTVAPTAAAKLLAAGTSFAGSVTVTANVGGVPIVKVVPVTYRLDDVKLLVSDEGVAFTKTPSLSLLSRALAVATNRGIPASWTATSSETWLDVTPAGTTPDPLVLTVDPAALASLAADALYLATVTVATGDFVDGVDTVRVGLWVGSVTPDLVTTIALGTPYVAIAMDPIRPYAYLHAGGTDLDVRNVLTGALVDTISSVASSLGAMAVAGDGSRLFVADDATHRIVPVRLGADAVDPSWAVTGTTPLVVAYARTNKVPVVLTSQGTVHAPVTGASYGTFARPWGTTFAIGASRSGTRLCVMERDTTTYALQCRGLDASTTPGLASPIVIGPALSNAWTGGSGNAVALSPDGTLVYAAPGPSYSIAVGDASSPNALGQMPLLRTLTAGFYPTAVTVSYDGRIFGGSTYSIYAYDTAGNQTRSWSAGSDLLGGPAVSGDGLRLVVLTRDAGLYSGPATKLKLLTAP